MMEMIEEGLRGLVGDEGWGVYLRAVEEKIAGADGVWQEGLEKWKEKLEAWQGVLKGAEGKIGVWTSGTTGARQRVEHGAQSLLRGIQGGSKHRDDVWGLTYAPGSFAFWQVVLQATYHLNPIVDLYRLGPTETLARIHDYRVTHLSGTPTFYRLLRDAGVSCPHIQAVTVGGESLDELALKAIRQLFPAAKVRNVYASTQAGVLLTSTTDRFTLPAERLGELRIVDGQLMVHPRLLGLAAEFDALGETFYPTGDLVEILRELPDGRVEFRFAGRASAVITVGGFKVSPERVEAVILARVPEVKAVRVFGKANSVTGQVVACEVVWQGAAIETGEFRQRLVGGLAPAEVPRWVEVVGEIEVTESGKVSRAGGSVGRRA